MVVRWFAFILAVFVGSSAFSQSLPNTFSYEGQLKDSSGNPVTSSTQQIRFDVLGPSGSCLLFGDERTLDLSATNGYFSVNIGGGTPLSGQEPLSRVFQNRYTINGRLDSDRTSACTFVPTSGDHRLLRISIWDGSAWQVLTPSQVITSVPMAASAESVQGYGLPNLTLALPTASAPSCGTPTTNMTYFDTTTKRLRHCDGAVWVDMTYNTLTAGSGITISESGGQATISLSAGGVTSSQIAGGAIGTTQIADGSIAAADLANGSVTTVKVASGAITGEKIAAGSVSADLLAQMGATFGQVLTWNGSAWAPSTFSIGVLGSTSLSDGAVTSAKILDGTIATVDLADGSVTDVKVGSGAITNDKIAVGTVSGDRLADNSIFGFKLQSGSVSADRLHASGASAGQVLMYNAGVWSPATLPSATVGTSGISDGSVTGPKIALGTISTDRIAVGAVSNDRIGLGAVSGDRIAAAGIAVHHLSYMGATTGQILRWTGTAWSPTSDYVSKGSDTMSGALGLNQVRAQMTGAPTNASYTWEGDVHTGMYQQGDGLIGFAANGNQVLVLSADSLYSSKALSMTGQTITNLGWPSHTLDAVNRAYSDLRMLGHMIATPGSSPGTGQVPTWNSASGWQFQTPGGGGSVYWSAGTGVILNANNMNATANTINVNVGTGANQIVQLDSLSQLPNVSGALLTNVSASSLHGRAVSSAVPVLDSVLLWNGSQWAPTDLSGTFIRKAGDTINSAMSGLTFQNSSFIRLQSSGNSIVVNAGLIELGSPARLNLNGSAMTISSGGHLRLSGSSMSLVGSTLVLDSGSVIRGMASSTIDMGGGRLFGLPAPAAGTDAVNRDWAESTTGGLSSFYVRKTGDTMVGVLRVSNTIETHRVLASPGGPGLPGYAFSGDSTTGIFATGGTIGLSSSGNTVIMATAGTLLVAGNNSNGARIILSGLSPDPTWSIENNLSSTGELRFYHSDAVASGFTMRAAGTTTLLIAGGTLSMAGFPIQNLAYPNGSQDAATKMYVDNLGSTMSNSNFRLGPSLVNPTGSANLGIGLASGALITTGSNNLAIGNYALSAVVGGSDNVAVGAFAGQAIASTANYNTFLGASVGQTLGGATSGNLMAGWRAAFVMPNGHDNVILGRSAAGAVNTTASSNTYIGSFAAQYSSGNLNTYIGSSAGKSMIGGSNTVIGSFTTAAHSGNRNIIIGFGAGSTMNASSRLGDGNIVIGPSLAIPTDSGAPWSDMLFVGSGTNYLLMGDLVRGGISVPNRIEVGMFKGAGGGEVAIGSSLSVGSWRNLTYEWVTGGGSEPRWIAGVTDESSGADYTIQRYSNGNNWAGDAVRIRRSDGSALFNFGNMSGGSPNAQAMLEVRGDVNTGQPIFMASTSNGSQIYRISGDINSGARVEQACPATWQVVSGGGRQLGCISPLSATTTHWNAAISNCRSQGARLPDIQELRNTQEALGINDAQYLWSSSIQGSSTALSFWPNNYFVNTSSTSDGWRYRCYIGLL